MQWKNEQTGKATGEAGSALGRALTKTEMEVLCLILDGKSNKEAARLLHRSVRTIEDHRSHIMHKLGVNNVVDLVKRATAMGIIDLPTDQ